MALKVRREKRRKKSANKQDRAPDATKKIRQLTGERDKVTQSIEAAEARVHEINEIFCDPSYFDRTPPKEVQRLESEQKRLKDEIETLMNDWAVLEEELGALES